jgi:hypothetical protein
MYAGPLQGEIGNIGMRRWSCAFTRRAGEPCCEHANEPDGREVVQTASRLAFLLVSGQAEAVEFGLRAVELVAGWVCGAEEDPEGYVEAA